MTKDVISLSISVLLLFRHYISHKILLVPPAVAGYYAVLALLFSFYKSAAARLESFSDNSSFPQIGDVLFIAPL